MRPENGHELSDLVGLGFSVFSRLEIGCYPDVTVNVPDMASLSLSSLETEALRKQTQLPE